MASTSNPSDPQNQGDPRPLPGEIIEQEVIRFEGAPQVVRDEVATGETLRPESTRSQVVQSEVVRVESGSAPVVHEQAMPVGVTRVETVRTEAVRVEPVHAESVHVEPAPAARSELTQDVFTVGDTFDPITHNPCDLHGIMVEYEDSEGLLEGVRRARRGGYRKMDCYSPIPVEGLVEEMGWRDKKVPALMLCGGLTGFSLAWLLQFSGMAWFYPVNIGGKPLNSWPQFIVPAFEWTILFTALTGVVSMIVLNGLPALYHPVFNTPGFDAASTDRFFLCLEAGDEQWNRRDTLQFARTLGGVRVSEVER